MSEYTAKLVASLKRQRESMAANGQDTSLIDKRLAAYETAPTSTPAHAESERESRQTTRKRR